MQLGALSDAKLFHTFGSKMLKKNKPGINLAQTADKPRAGSKWPQIHGTSQIQN
ncbi:hypothetical protein B988_03111, partial [Brucella suis F7/06-2]